jgi:cytoskeletal protein RodZ
MEPPGKHLKTGRELQNLSIEEASKLTKIRGRFLKAIEEDRYELLPPGLYLRGFLAAYARCLGLDPNDVVLRYQKYLEGLTISEEKPLEPQKLEPQKHVLFLSKRATLYLFLVLLSIMTLLVTFFGTQIPKESFRPTLDQKEPKLAPVPSGSQIQNQGRTQVVMSEPKKVKTEDTALSNSPNFKVIEADIGTVIEREGNHLVLKGKSQEFTCNNERIYFLTKIKTPEEGRIAHVWVWRGQEYHRIEIEVKAPAWCVYSYLTLGSHQSGDWKVEVRGGDKVLASLSFHVSGDKENLFKI